MRAMKLLRNKNRIITWMLITAILVSSLSGCGINKKAYDEPELLAPAQVSRMFRKPEMRDIKKVMYAEGVVVPKDYPAFYSNMTQIDAINVKVGDYVKKGDVIAIGNNAAADSNIEMTNRSINSTVSMNSVSQKINSLLIEIENYNRMEAEENNNDEGVNMAVTNISLINEDIRYSDEITNYRVNRANQKIENINENIGDSTLVADHSGYITFIKDISTNDTAMPYENVAIISDMDDLYIECPDLNVTNYKFEDYTEKYTFIDGKKVDVKELEYSQQVKSLASVQKTPLSMRFNINSGKLTVGQNMLIVFKKTMRENVMTVGVGAVESEGNSRYVYVRKNEDDIERRDVEIGYKNGSYIEIKYGLTADDEVYYALDEYIPQYYKEVEVAPGEMTVSQKSQFVLPKNSNIKGYYSEFPCKLEEIFVKTGDEVKAGDLLFTYQTDYTAAKLAEVQANITTLSKNHNDTLEMYYEMKQKIIDGVQQEPVDPEPEIHQSMIGKASWTDAISASSTDAILYDYDNFVDDIRLSDIPQMQVYEPKYVEEKKNLNLDVIDYRIEMENILYQSQLENLNKQYDKISKNNDGDGLISVYAENDGIIKNVEKEAIPGHFFKTRKYILSVSEKGYNEVLIQMREMKKSQFQQGDADTGMKKPANLGTKISMKLGDDFYTVNAIGTNGNTKPVYVAESDGKPVFTTCTPGSEFATQFYVDVVDGIDYDKALMDKNRVEVTFLSKDYQNLPVLDKGVIYSEYVDDKVYPYVWIDNDGELEKRYIDALVIDGYQGSDVIILDGLELGDKVVRETTETVEDE